MHVSLITAIHCIGNDGGDDGAHDDLVDIGHGGSVDNHDTPGGGGLKANPG